MRAHAWVAGAASAAGAAASPPRPTCAAGSMAPRHPWHHVGGAASWTQHLGSAHGRSASCKPPGCAGHAIRAPAHLGLEALFVRKHGVHLLRRAVGSRLVHAHLLAGLRGWAGRRKSEHPSGRPASAARARPRLRCTTQQPLSATGSASPWHNRRRARRQSGQMRHSQCAPTHRLHARDHLVLVVGCRRRGSG